MKVSSIKNIISVVPNFNKEPDWYDIKLGRKIIGNATLVMRPQRPAFDSDLVRFPQGWITGDDAIKPYLSVTYIEILKEKGKGFGRKAMQAIYAIAKNSDAQGRIALRSQVKPAGFYSHLGFDIPERLKSTLDIIYNACLEIAKEKKVSKKAFLTMLKDAQCPSKTNGRFNVAGLRFFTPTEENVAVLFRKSHHDKAVK